MKPVEARELIVQRLERDLVGPDAPDEIIDGGRSRPSDGYLTGILWPIGDRMDGGDDDGSDGDDEGEDTPSAPGLIGQQRPCSMGVSLATASGAGPHAVHVRVTFATYLPEDRVNEQTGKPYTRWIRRAHEFTLSDVILPVDGVVSRNLTEAGLEAAVEVHIRGQRAGSDLMSTVTIINRSRPAQWERRTIELLTLFQVKLEIKPVAGTLIIPRPGVRIANDEDDAIGRLLYRSCPEFAAGHQCSVGWDAEGMAATRVFSQWIPSATVTAFREDGHREFESSVKEGSFAADRLAESSPADLTKTLRELPDAYERWIRLQEARVPDLTSDLQVLAERNLETCRRILERIRRGIARIESDERLRLAFQLANAAMALQHSWKAEGLSAQLRWRPFQLGFILLAAESTCDANSADREVLDLLWFPTGGGKTEAYLAIVAMLAFHRRFAGENPDDGAGNVAVMRYTLRLLTAQQFERATALILASELIRRGAVRSLLDRPPLGRVQFSIGLWVGGDATPNSFEKALESQGQRDGSTPEQIDACPCCRSRVRWVYDEAAKKVQPHCENDECRVGPGFGPWPVFTVDTDVYRERPTLVIGTVDKFALLPFRTEVADLFGFRSSQSTDLIIQDELHLISGPLGTVAGLYETAFDWLLARDGRRPKIIGSTATIRRASQQIRALFDRESCQFPPPGIDHDDSGFAVRDEVRPGRLYLGVTTAGRSAKFALQAVAGSVLHSGGDAAIPSPDQRDGYATVLCYFNSLRELGGAIVQMLDDVPDSIDLYARRRAESPRQLKLPQELTSRVSQKEIVRVLNELKRTAADPNSIDVVLATNMVSVGVDVSRLGLMVMNGQPKTRSEYIQATSRVGRAAFPGLVVTVLNAAKPRDRSHFETFPSWHQTLYRDVEATSVTPYASRARDRALHAVLVSMIRHGAGAMRDRPRLADAPDELLETVVTEIERRIQHIDARELGNARNELDDRLEDWESRAPAIYFSPRKPNQSLLQSADRHARRRAAGRLTGAAWPTMNNMRSVEASTPFRMAEILSSAPRAGRNSPPTPGGTLPAEGAAPATEKPGRRWRRRSG